MVALLAKYSSTWKAVADRLLLRIAAGGREAGVGGMTNKAPRLWGGGAA